jgi:hypothetical protein
MSLFRLTPRQQHIDPLVASPTTVPQKPANHPHRVGETLSNALASIGGETANDGAIEQSYPLSDRLDPQREGLQQTPQRILRAWQDDWGTGYRQHTPPNLPAFYDENDLVSALRRTVMRTHSCFGC